MEGYLLTILRVADEATELLMLKYYRSGALWSDALNLEGQIVSGAAAI